MPEDKAHWVCSNCGDVGQEAIVIHAFNNGKVVDIIDILCKKSGCAGDMKLVGTNEQINAWWDADYEKVEL